MKFVELLEAYQATLWNYQNPSGNLKSMFFLKEQFEQARQALADYVDRLERMKVDWSNHIK